MTRTILIDYTPSHEDGDPELTYHVHAIVGWGVYDRPEIDASLYAVEITDAVNRWLVEPSDYGRLGIVYADIKEQVLAAMFAEVRE